MDLEQARQKVTSATKTANEYVSGANTIQDILKRKVAEVYDYNKDIVEPLDKATSQYMAAPATAREKYQDIFNPFTREKLVSQYTSNQMLPMLTYGNLYGQRTGSIADIVNAGTNAYKAEATQAQSAAELAQTEYENLLKEYELKQKAASTASETDWIKNLFPDGGTTTPTEPMPNYSPATGEGSLSANGEWIYTKGAWKPKTSETGGTKLDNETLNMLVLTGKLSPTQATYLQKNMGTTAGDKEKETAALLTRLNSLKNTMGSISSMDVLSQKAGMGFTDYPQSLSNFVTAKNLLGMEVTRMFEKGVLTDRDREFYLSMFPSEDDIVKNPANAKRKLQSVIEYFQSKVSSGGSGGSSISTPFDVIADTILSTYGF